MKHRFNLAEKRQEKNPHQGCEQKVIFLFLPAQAMATSALLMRTVWTRWDSDDAFPPNLINVTLLSLPPVFYGLSPAFASYVNTVSSQNCTLRNALSSQVPAVKDDVFISMG